MEEAINELGGEPIDILAAYFLAAVVSRNDGNDIMANVDHAYCLAFELNRRIKQGSVERANTLARELT